ncbi:MAG: hypothetical protein ACE5GQ_03635 [Nitrospinales bacterium]
MAVKTRRFDKLGMTPAEGIVLHFVSKRRLRRVYEMGLNALQVKWLQV